MRKMDGSLFVVRGTVGWNKCRRPGARCSVCQRDREGMAEGTTGILDMSSEKSLDFRAGSIQFSIPYAEITTVKCREENRFRLGVLATVAVGLLKARSKRHLVTVEWQPADGPPGVVTFDASKDKARGLASVLRARAPHACASAAPELCLLRLASKLNCDWGTDAGNAQAGFRQDAGLRLCSERFTK